jgi:hypothetical protein
MEELVSLMAKDAENAADLPSTVLDAIAKTGLDHAAIATLIKKVCLPVHPACLAKCCHI